MINYLFRERLYIINYLIREVSCFPLKVAAQQPNYFDIINYLVRERLYLINYLVRERLYMINYLFRERLYIINYLIREVFSCFPLKAAAQQPNDLDIINYLVRERCIHSSYYIYRNTTCGHKISAISTDIILNQC